ncbi:hypothetical protein Tco_0895741 [Tanacetum coccineum]|uniref:Uncharacterized protein n=1 Tax=Tanacetum coccineum TaxID=301880 RepID=A0ABQ5CGN7_9ASTR
MISVNNLKTDSENDNEKAGVPSFLPPKPTTSYIDDLDFFNDFEKEFPAIFYNDAQTSKSDLLTEPILSPQHIDEFNLNDETSVSEYDEEEQNILYYNDIFPFNITRLDDLNSEKDNNDNDIDIIQSSEDMALPLHEQRHPFLRYKELQYTKTDIEDFETRLTRIYRREIYRGVSLFTSRASRRLFDIRGSLVHELILEFYSTFRFGQAILDLDTPRALQFQLGGARRRMSWRDARQILDKGDLRDYWMGISSVGDFLGTTPSYTVIRDPILRLCHRLIACSIAGRSQAPKKVTVTDLFYLRGMDVDSVNAPYLLAKYLRLFAAGRKSMAHISGGQFVARLAEYFGLLTAEILGGLTIIAPELSIIDMDELAPQQPPPPPPPAVSRTMPQRMARLEEDVHKISGALTEQREPGSKFRTIVHEYVMKPSRIFTLDARMGKKDDFKCVEAEEKSNLKTSLYQDRNTRFFLIFYAGPREKKYRRMSVKDLQSGNLESVGVLKPQGGCSTRNLANKLNMENLHSKYQGSFLF